MLAVPRTVLIVSLACSNIGLMSFSSKRINLVTWIIARIIPIPMNNASTATIFGRVTDNVQVAEVTIDGQPVTINSDGSFSTEGYIPRAGREAEVIAYDLKGNQSSQTLFLTREETQEAQGPVFASLNPSGKRVQSNPDALALIIGVADC